MLRALMGGLFGTLALTAVAYSLYPLVAGGVPLDIVGGFGYLLGESWLIGLVAHFTIGVFFAPALYLVLEFHRILPGRPLVRGLLWGTLGWIVAQLAVAPIAGGGFFGMVAGGVPEAAGYLVGLLTYGVVFGLVTHGLRTDSAAAPELEEPIRVRRAG
jgi:hypothetical protein